MAGRGRGHFARTERPPHYPDQLWGCRASPETTLLWPYGPCPVGHPLLYCANVLGSPMTQSTSSYASAPRPGENTWIWLIKIVTGPLLVIVLGLHLAVNHYLGTM